MTPEQFLLFAAPLPEPMLLVSGDGLALAANPAAEGELGPELRGRELAGLAADPPDDVARYLRRCSRSGNLVLGALTLRGPDGGEVAWRAEGAAVRPKAAGAEAVVMLRLLPKRTASAEFLALNRRIGELAAEVQRRRQAEEEAREQQERLRVTLHSIGDGVIVTDPEGRVSMMNRVAESLTGWGQAEAAGRPLESVFHIVNESTRRAVDNPALRALREGVIVGLANHTVLIARGGRERPIDDTAAPITDGRGEVIGSVLVFRDLSARRQAELRVRASEQRFQSFMRNSPATAYIKDAGGRYVFVNRRLEEVFGRPAGDWVGKTDLELFPRGEAEEYRRNDAEVLSSRASARFAETATLPDGVHHYLSFKFPLQDRDGSWLLAGMSVDVTDQKRAEESLRESEERFRTLADLIPQLVWAARADGHIYWYNRRWYEYTGTTPREMEGWGWQAVHDPAVLPGVLGRWRASIATGEPFEMVFPLRGADGAFRPFLTRIVPLKDRGGRVVQWFGTNTDISEQQAMEEALREEDRRKNEFLATLAHELRNPLAPIRNGLRVLRLAGDDPAAAEQARGMMERQLQHLVRLVDDLLDLSRVSRGKVELRKARVELSAVVASALESADPLVRESGHELTVALPDGPVHLDADRTRLAQALYNLLSNAVKYSPRGSRIWLTAERQGAEAVVRVRDEGVGIPPHMLTRVFEMFTQVDRSLEKAQGGLGIGLAIVRSLVEMHGGTVTAHSAGDGTGSEFVVRLPAAAEAPPAHREADGGPGQRTAARRRVLVVDDNVDAAASLALMLKLLGNEVRTAHDGLRGVEEAAAFRPDLILLDIGMPRLNGYDACRRIRTEPWGAGVVIAALTGWGQEEDRRRSHEAGFDHHFIKPLEPDALEKLLASVSPRGQDGGG